MLQQVIIGRHVTSPVSNAVQLTFESIPRGDTQTQYTAMPKHNTRRYPKRCYSGSFNVKGKSRLLYNVFLFSLSEASATETTSW